MFKWMPEIDPQLCTGCGRCVEACGPGSLGLVCGIAALTRPATCGSEEHCIGPCEADAIRMAWIPFRGDAARGRCRTGLAHPGPGGDPGSR